ncbi:hypothetical protein TIFTF001_054492 [Ficus carica]|uniref:Uncharacterized protein n=1 Tax=Ficus carica TaxID=3494 RepID=A0AA88EI14_FICCA|nr:hypothetical protein TIFTF001_054492 [Ficus carica]
MQEPEIEYVEGDYELEEEDDIEDFGGLAMDHIHTDDDNVGIDEDDEPHSRKRGRKESLVASKKLGKDGSGAKLKKTRVHVEVEHEDADGRQKVPEKLLDLFAR